MVGVDVRFERVYEFEAKLAEQRQIAIDGFQHRIDQRCFARFLAADK